MKRLLSLVGVLLIASLIMGGCMTSTPANEVSTIDEAGQTVYLHLDRLAQTTYAKQFLGDFYDTFWELGFIVFDSNGNSKGVNHGEDYQGWDVRGYAVEFAFPTEATLHGTLGDEVHANWQGESVKLCSWLVDAVDGTVRPYNGNAYRVEAELVK